MKQKDIVTIMFIVGFSAILSILVTRFVISTPKNRQQKVEIVEAISSEFSRPSEKYFNKDSVNPTQTIKIGTDSNAKPIHLP